MTSLKSGGWDQATGRQYTGGEDTTALVCLTSLSAGTAAAAITAPIDNLKVREQIWTIFRHGSPNDLGLCLIQA